MLVVLGHDRLLFSLTIIIPDGMICQASCIEGIQLFESLQCEDFEGEHQVWSFRFPIVGPPDENDFR